ncbi:MAG: PQQ-binding-like beta-propeller repeat protein, partial [Verrucomicrobiales bacterium]
WKTLISGRGWSAPVLLGKQVWLTTAFETPFHPKELVDRPKDDKGEPIDILAQVELHAIGMDRDSGKVLHSIPLLNVPKPQMVHKQNSYASPAPVIEEDRLFAHFGTYGTVCVDTKSGEIVWKNEDLHIEHENGPGSCPILWKNLLIFHMDGSDVQFIVALVKVTGKIVWKRVLAR